MVEGSCRRCHFLQVVDTLRLKYMRQNVTVCFGHTVSRKDKEEEPYTHRARLKSIISVHAFVGSHLHQPGKGSAELRGILHRRPKISLRLEQISCQPCESQDWPVLKLSLFCLYSHVRNCSWTPKICILNLTLTLVTLEARPVLSYSEFELRFRREEDSVVASVRKKLQLSPSFGPETPTSK